MRRWVALGVVAMIAATAWGQDTRQVTEPKIPPSCIKLPAQLRAVDDKIAEVDEGRLDTERIQKALDTCKAGMAVELETASGNNAFLSGPLEMRSGVTLLVDKGVTLYGSRDAAVYESVDESRAADATPGLCGTIATGAPPAVFPAPQRRAPVRGGCRPLISVMNAKDVGIMGDGVIDGRGYAQILHKDYSWWQMSRRAEPKNERYFTPRMIVASHADGLVLYRITLHNSTNFHVSVNGTNGFTAWGVHLLTPTTRGMDARNTDGIDPGSSTNITVTHSWIDNGDDNIAIKTGTTHMSVLDNHFYNGHGMSIGSETFSGDSYLLVDGLTEDHTTSGIRIKSNATRGGLVHDAVYRNNLYEGCEEPNLDQPLLHQPDGGAGCESDVRRQQDSGLQGDYAAECVEYDSGCGVDCRLGRRAQDGDYAGWSAGGGRCAGAGAWTLCHDDAGASRNEPGLQQDGDQGGSVCRRGGAVGF